ncbi:MAG: hypothetical protein ACOCXQ_01300 [Patescibacteria group bacterium]
MQEYRKDLQVFAVVFDKDNTDGFNLRAVGGSGYVCFAMSAELEDGNVFFLVSQYEEFCPLLHSQAVFNLLEEIKLTFKRITRLYVVANAETQWVRLFMRLLTCHFRKSPEIALVRPGRESEFGPNNPHFFSVELQHIVEEEGSEDKLCITDGQNIRQVC